MKGFANQQRKKCLTLVKDVERKMEKQFYDEFHLLEKDTGTGEGLFVVHEENEEIEHVDLEEEEQKWFNTQLEWTKRVVERKGATHRYFKDNRPSSSRENTEKNTPSTAKGPNRQRKKLEDAIKFTKNK